MRSLGHLNVSGCVKTWNTLIIAQAGKYTEHFIFYRVTCLCIAGRISGFCYEPFGMAFNYFSSFWPLEFPLLPNGNLAVFFQVIGSISCVKWTAFQNTNEEMKVTYRDKKLRTC